MLNRSASLAMSTCVLKALPGKLDIKRHSPSILYITDPRTTHCSTRKSPQEQPTAAPGRVPKNNPLQHQEESPRTTHCSTRKSPQEQPTAAPGRVPKNNPLQHQEESPRTTHCSTRKSHKTMTCILASPLRNEFDFWKVHGIMNTSGLLQSK